MPDLLLELFCEEIPARMQGKAAEDLRRLITDGLVNAGLTYEGAKGFVTPRRLALTVHGLTARSADTREERKGPRVGSPPQALEGFLRAAGLRSIEEASVQSDPKKGEFYVAVMSRPGRGAEEIIAALVPEVIRGFPWPKSMRWGSRSAPPGTAYSPADAEGANTLRWVRPLRSILCTFGPETEEPAVVPIEISGVRAGDLTLGHRFMGGGEAIRVRRFADYVEKLAAAKVVLDHERRRAIIEAEAQNLAFAQGLELVADPGLLDEVAGLVEWPVVLMGSFDADFLEIPDEVIRLTIRQNQKCFVLRGAAAGGGSRGVSYLPLAGRSSDAEGGDRVGASERHPTPDLRSDPPRQGEGWAAPARLTNRFLLTANIEASDGGAAIIAGNERVIRARLSDARFFWKQDQRIPLEEHARKLQGITFHAKLGSQAERVERIARLARDLAPVAGANPDDAERAAGLAKADLVTEMVGEFPELQGVMGRYYALAQGEKPEIADAIRDHYKPAGPGDAVPTEPVAVAVALADKLDMLVGFWAVDEKPTGSKDPFALRRAALGVIRIFLENGLKLNLTRPLIHHGDLFAIHDPVVTASELLQFIGERLQIQLRTQGARYDLVDAVFDLGIEKRRSSPGTGHVRDLLLIVRRVEALGKFLETEEGANLLTGYRRAANILRAEEKRDGEGAFKAEPDQPLIEERGLPEERVLFDVMQQAERQARDRVEAEDFAGAMTALAALRPAVDAFFDKVTVNDPDPAMRSNRLKLLNQLRRATLTVADFSRIGG